MDWNFIDDAEQIMADVAEIMSNDPEVKLFLKMIQDKSIKCGFAECYAYAKKLGEVVADQLEMLASNGGIQYDIDDFIRYVVPELLSNTHELVMVASEEVQRIVDRVDDLKLGSVKPKVDKAKVENVVTSALESSEDAKIGVLKVGVKTFSEQSFDDFIRSNATFRFDSGIPIQIVRTYEGGHMEHTGKGSDRHKHPRLVDCKWCKSLAGTYDYEDVRDTGNDVFRRHKGCHCQTIYKNNVRRFLQGTHTKTIATNEAQAKDLDVGTMYGGKSGTGKTKGSKYRIRYDSKCREVNRMK